MTDAARRLRRALVLVVAMLLLVPFGLPFALAAAHGARRSVHAAPTPTSPLSALPVLVTLAGPAAAPTAALLLPLALLALQPQHQCSIN